MRNTDISNPTPKCIAKNTTENSNDTINILNTFRIIYNFNQLQKNTFPIK